MRGNSNLARAMRDPRFAAWAQAELDAMGIKPAAGRSAAQELVARAVAHGATIPEADLDAPVQAFLMEYEMGKRLDAMTPEGAKPPPKLSQKGEEERDLRRFIEAVYEAHPEAQAPRRAAPASDIDLDAELNYRLASGESFEGVEVRGKMKDRLLRETGHTKPEAPRRRPLSMHEAASAAYDKATGAAPAAPARPAKPVSRSAGTRDPSMHDAVRDSYNKLAGEPPAASRPAYDSDRDAARAAFDSLSQEGDTNGSAQT